MVVVEDIGVLGVQHRHPPGLDGGLGPGGGIRRGRLCAACQQRCRQGAQPQKGNHFLFHLYFSYGQPPAKKPASGLPPTGLGGCVPALSAPFLLKENHWAFSMWYTWMVSALGHQYIQSPSVRGVVG